jgi:ATP-binding cassette, subfamily G (WHITE), member 2, SNQ2
MYQLKQVILRNNLALWRSPDYIFTRLIVCIEVSLFVSLSYLNLGHSVRDLQYRVFGAFWVIILPVVCMGQVEPLFLANRAIFVRG